MSDLLSSARNIRRILRGRKRHRARRLPAPIGPPPPPRSPTPEEIRAHERFSKGLFAVALLAFVAAALVVGGGITTLLAERMPLPLAGAIGLVGGLLFVGFFISISGTDTTDILVTSLVTLIFWSLLFPVFQTARRKVRERRAPAIVAPVTPAR
jgi:hypothetical protein